MEIGPYELKTLDLPYTAPQGCVCGPLLFTLYTSKLSHVTSRFKVTYHLYAVDPEVCVSFDLSYLLILIHTLLKLPAASAQ